MNRARLIVEKLFSSMEPQRGFRSGLLILAVAMIVGMGQTVVGQSRGDGVKLHLIHRVEAPGGAPYTDAPPPAGTEVAVVPVDGNRSRTIPNLAPITRDSLIQRASGVPRESLTAQGKTPTRYATTGTTHQIYYVLARTPDGSLYESYVNTGTLSSPQFVPGADAVQSGRMTIGPVPRDARALMQPVFESESLAMGGKKGNSPTQNPSDEKKAAASEVDPAQDTPAARDASSASSSETDQESTVQRTTMASESAGETEPGEFQQVPQPGLAETDQDGWNGWSLFLGGAVGLLVGLGVGWVVQHQRYRDVAEDRDFWESKFREEQARAYREATGIRLQGETKEDPGRPSPERHAEEQDVDDLREANAKLHAENQELKQRLREVKDHVQKMRDEDDDSEDASATERTQSASDPSASRTSGSEMR